MDLNLYGNNAELVFLKKMSLYKGWLWTIMWLDPRKAFNKISHLKVSSAMNDYDNFNLFRHRF
jgi:hypothetical protein